jgi:hypothetical protein
MRRNNRRPLSILVALAVISLITILALPAVLADGDTRKPTQAEKDFTKTVLTAFAKALPPGPTGWEQTSTTPIQDLTSVTAGIDNLPLWADYSTGWRDKKKIQDAEMQFNEALINLAQGPPEKITDTAISDLQKQYTAKDATLKVALSANNLSWSIYEKKLNPQPAIAGGLVYRSDGKFGSSGDWLEGTTYVFLGKGWKLNGNSGSYWMEFSQNKSLPRTVMQCMFMRVEGDQARAQQFLDKVDWASLTKLIKN